MRKSIDTSRLERYSGREFEADMLGSVDVKDPRFIKRFLELGGNPEKPYLSFNQALKLVKEFQPGGSDPKNPKKDFLRELRLAVADELNLETDEALDRLEAYSAVGTPLDIYHGVDGFVIYQNESGSESLVTMDVTLREEKQLHGGKADVIISDLPSPEENEEAYLAQIQTIARDIAYKIKKEKELDRRYARAV